MTYAETIPSWFLLNLKVAMLRETFCWDLKTHTKLTWRFLKLDQLAVLVYLHIFGFNILNFFFYMCNTGHRVAGRVDCW